ncbi:MAG: acyltransferase domain-containing protein [Candidatus Coproplasma sp.]
MKNVITLCNKIEMPEGAVSCLKEIRIELTDAQQESYISKLCQPNTYESATKELIATLGDDPDGMKILYIMLQAALHSHELYRKRGIADYIFIDTMKCFSRFVSEVYANSGRIAFDRAFWVGRQLSLQLFRLGCLEYELSELNKTEFSLQIPKYLCGNAISVHIPSDAVLTKPSLEQSVLLCNEFLSSYFNNYANAPRFCYTWLLSPQLKCLLSPTSHIRNFQDMFDIIAVNYDSEAYKRWVFGDSDAEPEDFKEITSLQRSIKQYVLSGGKIGEGFGILKSKNCLSPTD